MQHKTKGLLSPDEVVGIKYNSPCIAQRLCLATDTCSGVADLLCVMIIRLLSLDNTEQ